MGGNGSHWQAVLDEADLDAGRAVTVRVGAAPVVVVRVAGGVRALSGICPHDHASLAGGAVRGRVLECPRHRARFDVDSGACVAGFALPALKCYPARLRDGRVEVDARAVTRDPPLPAPGERWDLTRR